MIAQIGRLPDFSPLPPNLIEVPFVQQAQGFSCGAAASLLLLRYWAVEGHGRIVESDLYESLQTTSARGTEPEPIVNLFRGRGLEAAYRSGDVRIADLERAVDACEPPVVDLQAWRDHPTRWLDTWEAGHYVVMVGYDTERLFFADPSRATPDGYAFLGRDELDERWHDLAGPDDLRVERMAIFVRGRRRWQPDRRLPPYATKLG